MRDHPELFLQTNTCTLAAVSKRSTRVCAALPALHEAPHQGIGEVAKARLRNADRDRRSRCRRASLERRSYVHNHTASVAVRENRGAWCCREGAASDLRFAIGEPTVVDFKHTTRGVCARATARLSALGRRSEQVRSGIARFRGSMSQPTRSHPVAVRNERLVAERGCGCPYIQPRCP